MGSAMKPISPMDALFLIGESREHPMHVGSLQLFKPPEDAGPHFVRDAYQAMLSARRCNRPFVSTPPSSAASPTSHGRSTEKSSSTITFVARPYPSLDDSATYWSWLPGCTAACSIATGRFGKRTLSKVFRMAVTRSTEIPPLAHGRWIGTAADATCLRVRSGR